MIDPNLIIDQIHRIAIHRIIQKTRRESCSAQLSNSLLDLSDDVLKALQNRVQKALDSKSKTFRLDFEKDNEGSVLSMLRQSEYRVDNDAFLSFSKNFANNLACAQDKEKIPGGYCIVIDGKIELGKYFVCVIKADNQEVFNINGDNLVLLKNVFLSPAQELYKIGFFVEYSEDIFIPYMYDDLFTLLKKDLTRYFYYDFLGLKTSNHDGLKTKNLYNDIKLFLEKYVTNNLDYTSMICALNTYFRENPTHTISAQEFSDRFFLGTELEAPFRLKVVHKYPFAFSLDTSRLPKNFNRIKIGSNTIITELSTRVSAYSLEQFTPDILQTDINSGMNKTIVVLETKSCDSNSEPMELIGD